MIYITITKRMIIKDLDLVIFVKHDNQITVMKSTDGQKVKLQYNN